MIDLMQWHPRIKPSNLPEFLHDYRVIHFLAGEEEDNATKTVRTLYHTTFDSAIDRECIIPALAKGETISIWEVDNPTAIGALTFLQVKNYVLVLFWRQRWTIKLWEWQHFCFPLHIK
jgi:hypothetical protein